MFWKVAIHGACSLPLENGLKFYPFGPPNWLKLFRFTNHPALNISLIFSRFKSDNLLKISLNFKNRIAWMGKQTLRSRGGGEETGGGAKKGKFVLKAIFWEKAAVWEEI